MTRQRRPVRHYTIAEHWYRAGRHDFVADLHDPQCFACCWFPWEDDWPDDLTASQRWSRAGFERAHLVPFSMGGSEDPSNLVLLCHECHRDAPDVPDPSYMLEWITNRESWAQRLGREAQALGLGEDDFDIASDPLYAEEVRDIAADFVIGWGCRPTMATQLAATAMANAEVKARLRNDALEALGVAS